MAEALLLRARKIAADVVRSGAAGSLSATVIEKGLADHCTEVQSALAALRTLWTPQGSQEVRIFRHPRFAGRPHDGASYPGVADMPILDTVKRFVTFNESTVCNAEIAPGQFHIVIGFSRHDRNDGVAIPQSIDEAEAMIALLRNAIADQRRMEAGQAPLARAGKQALQ